MGDAYVLAYAGIMVCVVATARWLYRRSQRKMMFDAIDHAARKMRENDDT